LQDAIVHKHHSAQIESAKTIYIPPEHDEFGLSKVRGVL